MDKRKDCKIPKYGKLPNLAGMPLVVGAKQLKKAVKAGRVRYVFLAENADPAVTEPLAEMCTANHIQITWVRTMAELAQEKGVDLYWVGKMHDLGRACNIDVGAAAAATLPAQN